MKLIVSNKIYFKHNNYDLLSKIEKSLTYLVDNGAPGKRGMPSRPKYLIRFGKIRDVYWVPTGKLDYLKEVFSNEKLEIIDKRVLVPAKIPKPSFTLRKDQQQIYNECNDSCIINGKPGLIN